MNELVEEGKKKTILISMSIVLVSIHTIYFYHSVLTEIEIKKIVQQSIRFILTVGLLIMVYQGKKWAKNLSLVLFAVSILGGIIGLATINVNSFVNKIPLIVMILIYSIALYHFGFSKGFKAFFEFQNREK